MTLWHLCTPYAGERAGKVAFALTRQCRYVGITAYAPDDEWMVGDRNLHRLLDRLAEIMKLDAAVFVTQTGTVAIEQFAFLVTERKLGGIPGEMAVRNGMHQAGNPITID